MTLHEAMIDPNLFGNWFRGASWRVWLTIAKVLSGVSLTDAEWAIYTYIAGRQSLPELIRQLWIMAGRRSGKSLFMAFVGIYQAIFRDWSKVLTKGETGVVAVFCPSRSQGKIIHGYARAFCENIPMLKGMVAQITTDAIIFTNGIRLEIKTASYRTPRGFTVVCAIIDEACFLRDESSSNPFGEILRALKPGMATTRGLLMVISSPYSQSGEFFKAHERFFGQEHSSILFLKGATEYFNPSVDVSVIRDAFEEDPIAAASEYGSLEDGILFRSDVSDFIGPEALQACVIPGRVQLPPCENVTYRAFCDPSGGSSDSMTLAIAHTEDSRQVLDLVLERRPPFSPESVVEEFAAQLKVYGLSSVQGDRYGGLWPRERFHTHGITYQVAEKTKSELYQALLPLLNSSQVELLDNQRLKGQLLNLERRTARGGRDTVDHSPGAHDDLANSVAGALAGRGGRRIINRPLMY